MMIGDYTPEHNLGRPLHGIFARRAAYTMISSEKAALREDAQPALKIDHVPAKRENYRAFPLVIEKWPRSIRLSFMMVAALLLWIPILLFLL